MGIHVKMSNKSHRNDLTNTLCSVWPNLAEHRDKIYTYYIGPNSQPWDIFEELPDDTFIKSINKQIDNGKNIIMLYNISEVITKLTIDKLHKCLPYLNIDPSKIYHVTGALDGPEQYEEYCKSKDYTERITILSANIFLKVLQEQNLSNVYTEYVPKVRLKKFLCFNRVARVHRLSLMGNLIINDLLDTGYCSFYGNNYDNSWVDYIHFNKKLSTEIKYVLFKNKNLFPMHLTGNKLRRFNPIGIDLSDVPLFENSYYSIVTETYFYENSENDPRASAMIPAIFFTEKIYKPISMRHPFILVSRANSLKWLRKLGFKTFSPFINESYDDEMDDDNRMNLIIEEIKRLNQLSESEWLEWQQEIKAIVDYNFELFISLHVYAFNPNKDLDFL